MALSILFSYTSQFICVCSYRGLSESYLFLLFNYYKHYQPSRLQQRKKLDKMILFTRKNSTPAQNGQANKQSTRNLFIFNNKNDIFNTEMINIDLHIYDFCKSQIWRSVLTIFNNFKFHNIPKILSVRIKNEFFILQISKMG